MTNSWSFNEPENLAVITLKKIVSQKQPILRVSHDDDDGGWQFLGLKDADESEAAVVALRTIVRLDPTVNELADLPLGWLAWRQGPNSPWQRKKG